MIQYLILNKSFYVPKVHTEEQRTKDRQDNFQKQYGGDTHFMDNKIKVTVNKRMVLGYLGGSVN